MAHGIMTFAGQVSRACILTVGAALLISAGSLPSRGAAPSEKPILIMGTLTARDVVRTLTTEYAKFGRAGLPDYRPSDSDFAVACLKKHECDVALAIQSLAVADRLDNRFEVFPLGRYAIGVVVNSKGPIRQIRTDELSSVFQGKITSWSGVGNLTSTQRIELFSPSLGMTRSYIFKHCIMGNGGFAKELWERSAKPQRQNQSSDEVMGEVIKNRGGIGFFQLGPDMILDKRVRVLGIVQDKHDKSVTPTLESIADGSYPITDRLTLYLHPDAPLEASEFCKFATGPEAAKIITQFGLWPEHGLEKVRGQQRLAEVKAGKAVEIVVCDLTGKDGILNDLSAEFVKAKTAVQLKFQRAETRDTAIEKLNKGASELLLANGPIATRSQRSGDRGQGSANHKSPAEKGTVPGTLQGEGQSPFPRSIELGRMAVGIIVHPENPLESLPMDEAKSIFCGEVKKWPAVRGAAAAMHVFGLKHTDSTTQLLKEKLVERGRSLKYNTQPDNEKVILAVARDPAAIGFVDMSQLPPNDKSVKLVPVFEGKSKSQTPNPLSRTLTLYVSPNASQTAKDFADFLTPEHCKEVIAQYNLLPPLHVEETKLAKTTPARERPQIDLASANEPIPLLLDDPDAPQGQVKPKKLAVKSKPVIPTPEQPVTPKPVPDAQPAPETESEPQPTQTHPGAPSLTDEQIVWLVGGIAGVVLLALGVGWLQAPHRKRKRR